LPTGTRESLPLQGNQFTNDRQGTESGQVIDLPRSFWVSVDCIMNRRTGGHRAKGEGSHKG